MAGPAARSLILFNETVSPVTETVSGNSSAVTTYAVGSQPSLRTMNDAGGVSFNLAAPMTMGGRYDDNVMYVLAFRDDCSHGLNVTADDPVNHTYDSPSAGTLYIQNTDDFGATQSWITGSSYLGTSWGSSMPNNTGVDSWAAILFANNGDDTFTVHYVDASGHTATQGPFTLIDENQGYAPDSSYAGGLATSVYAAGIWQSKNITTDNFAALAQEQSEEWIADSGTTKDESTSLANIDISKTNIITSAGAQFAVSATAPATHDQAGFIALTFTDIAEVVDGGAAGKTYNKVDHSPLGEREVLSLKGSYSEGIRTLALGRDVTDAGQVLLLAALDVDTCYSFRITFQNGDRMYFTATVDSYTDDINTIDTIVSSTVALAQAGPTIRVDG